MNNLFNSINNSILSNNLCVARHSCNCGCSENKICIDIFGINQIIFNLNLIIFFYQSGLIHDELKKELKQIIINIPFKKVTYENIIYYINNKNINVMKINNIEYYYSNNKYYRFVDNIELIDNNQTFINLNNYLFSEIKLIYILNGCANIINELHKLYNKHINFKDNKIIFKNCKLILKIIDVSFFYNIYQDEIKLKDIWEFYYDDKSLKIILINIISILNNFKILKNFCKN